MRIIKKKDRDKFEKFIYYSMEDFSENAFYSNDSLLVIKNIL